MRKREERRSVMEKEGGEEQCNEKEGGEEECKIERGRRGGV